MAEINLSRGRVALVSDEDLPLIDGFTWWFAQSRHTGYAFTWMHRKTAFMHRIILGATKGQCVDHINRDGLDNRRSNLRFCTPSQNRINSTNSANKTGYRGVYPASGTKKFRASIGVDGRALHLGGAFNSARDAAEAYDAAAVKHYGAFAVLNFPRGDL